MNILFDLTAVQPERNLKFHGGSEYAKAVFWAIAPVTKGRLFCIYDAGRSLDEEIKSYCKTNELPLIDIRNHDQLDPLIEEYRIERFFSALPLEKSIQHFLPFNQNVRSIITIHGLRNLELPYDRYEFYYTKGWRNWLKYFYKRLFPSHHKSNLLLKIKGMINNYNRPVIISVSEYSRRSLKHFIPEIPDTDIHVFYSPLSNYFLKDENDSFLMEMELEAKKYFLLISAGIWQKNAYRILTAYHQLNKENHLNEYKFIVVGAAPSIRKAFPDSSFIYFDYLDRAILEILLKNAHALVYPSLNEGFGYPPLEAFKYGTGVLASAIGPVLEVCGNAALYFNPYSVPEMKRKILQSLQDPMFINDVQSRIDQYNLVREKQTRDLDSLVHLICD